MIIVKIQGGLGNQMFEYAMGRTYQEKYQESLCLDYSIPHSQNSNSKQLDVLKKFNTKYDRVISRKREGIIISGFNGILYELVLALFKVIRKIWGDEKRFSIEMKYKKILNKYGYFICLDRFLDFNESKANNKLLFGYWQCEKYFASISDKLKQELSLKEIFLTKQGLQHKDDMTKTNSICVHIRRGDYLSNPLHLLCKETYYITAIEMMESKVQNPVFYMFSDDLAWVKKNIKCKGKMIYIDNIKTDYEELAIMSYCKHFIISNSSFSWWAQYLSTNHEKKVIAPSRWYNGKTSDIYMNGWYLLKV